MLKAHSPSGIEQRALIMKQAWTSVGHDNTSGLPWRRATAALYGLSALLAVTAPASVVQAQAAPTCAPGYYWTGAQCAAMPTTPTPAPALSACVLAPATPLAWGAACTATQNAGAPLKPGQTFTLQNATPGYLGSITRICGLNGVLATIAAPCAATGSFVPPVLQSSTGDWTLGFIGQVKPVTLTVNSTGGCGSTHRFEGTATVSRDGSIALVMPPYSGFGSCTAPRPYQQNPTSCTLVSPSDGQSAFTFAPGFVVSSVAAVNDRGSGCR